MMTRLSVGTLRYWRYARAGGPASFKLGRRVMYRRADVEKWLGSRDEGTGATEAARDPLSALPTGRRVSSTRTTAA
jgi:hypothetical protein